MLNEEIEWRKIPVVFRNTVAMFLKYLKAAKVDAAQLLQLHTYSTSDFLIYSPVVRHIEESLATAGKRTKEEGTACRIPLLYYEIFKG